MAASSSSTSPLSNFLSHHSPSKPHLPITMSPPQFLPQNNKPKQFVPLIASINTSLSVSSPSSTSDILPVSFPPSLAYANAIFFYNVQIPVDKNEPEEKLVSRFRSEVLRAGIIQECKRRMFFENKREKKKRKAREAAKRNRKRRPWSRALKQNRQEDTKKKKDDDEEEDNWELPEGDLPC